MKIFFQYFSLNNGNRYKLCLLLIFLFLSKNKKLKIGVIGLPHNHNIGNNLIKYSISIKLSELGFIPYIIGLFYEQYHYDISFIKNFTNLIIIKTFSEIKKNDFDILMVNSDQVWRKKYLDIFYDFAFLYFARNWNIYKFIYGASLGSSEWKFNQTDEKVAKICLKSFQGISVREIGAVGRIKKHLGFKPIFVLDPTFLIDTKYYINLANSYISNNFTNRDYIFTYLFTEEKEIVRFIEDSAIKLNYKLFKVKQYHKNSVKKFLYGIYNCRAVITNSYHGTVFSIIFRKPFVTFIYKYGNNDRFDSLKRIFNIGNRIFEYNKIPNFNLLTLPLDIDQNLFDLLKTKSIEYLKNNLKHFKRMKHIYF